MKTKIVLAFASLAAMAACAAPEGWTDDFAAAKEQAKREGKLLLVDFSGSDWCGWCKRLDSEVFSQQKFLEEAPKDFVLVLIDSPRNRSLLPEETMKRNRELVSQYKVRGYPTVMLMDADGKVLGRTGYRQGGPEAYLEHLAQQKKSGLARAGLEASIASLEKGSPERVARIAEMFDGVDESSIGEDDEEYICEILAADADGRYAAKFPEHAFVRPIDGRARDLMREIIAGGPRGRTGDAAADFKADQEYMAGRLPEIREKVAALKAEVAEARKKVPESAHRRLDAVEKRLDGLVGGLEKFLELKEPPRLPERPASGRKGERAKKDDSGAESK